MAVNYYKVLRIQPDATTAQVKSAYRRLARKKHPDLNKGNEKLALEFARITDAYKILANSAERARYDRRRLKKQFARDDSIFNSDNVHAQRVRQMAYERQYNAIVDRMITEERLETTALQRIIFPLVSLFISTIFVAVFRPLFWTNSNLLGKAIVLGLFTAGLLHLIKRIYDGLERYTYTPIDIHDSILNDINEDARQYSRLTGLTFLFAGLVVSIGIGLLIGNFLELMNKSMMPGVYSPTLRPEFLLYPPIVVLVVDVMHAIFARFEH